MKILILAAGPDDGWEAVTPKQLMPVAGEPLLLRTLRELAERGYAATVVTDKSRITALVEGCFAPERTDTIFHTILSTRELWQGRVLVLLGDQFYTGQQCDQFLGYQGSVPVCFDSFALLFDADDAERVVAALETRGAVPAEDFFNRLWLYGDLPKVDVQGACLDFDIMPYYDKFLEENPWAETVLVILAAGDGCRLGGRNKALLEFGGRSLLERILDAADALHVRRAAVVVGYQAGRVRECLGQRRGGVEVSYVLNDAWATTKTGDSLLAARSHWQGHHLLAVSADHLFEPDLLAWLMAQQPPGTWVLADGDAKLDGEETILLGDTEGRLISLVYPARSLDDRRGLRGECPELFRVAAEDGERLAEHLTGHDVFEAVNELFGVRWVPDRGEAWIEIDTPEDLERANLLWEQMREKE